MKKFAVVVSRQILVRFRWKIVEVFYSLCQMLRKCGNLFSLLLTKPPGNHLFQIFGLICQFDYTQQ